MHDHTWQQAYAQLSLTTHSPSTRAMRFSTSLWQYNFALFSCILAAAPRRAIAKPLLHSAVFRHRQVRLRHALSLAICSCHTTTTTYYTTSAHMAAAAAANCTHLSLTTTIGISSSTTTTLPSSTYYAYSSLYRTVLRRSLHLDDCATIPAATATHTPNPSVSIRSTFPFVHVATTTSYTTCLTYPHHADPPTSSTTTSNSCSSSIRQSLTLSCSHSAWFLESSLNSSLLLGFRCYGPAVGQAIKEPLIFNWLFGFPLVVLEYNHSFNLMSFLLFISWIMKWTSSWPTDSFIMFKPSLSNLICLHLPKLPYLSLREKNNSRVTRSMP